MCQSGFDCKRKSLRIHEGKHQHVVFDRMNSHTRYNALLIKFWSQLVALFDLFNAFMLCKN